MSADLNISKIEIQIQKNTGIAYYQKESEKDKRIINFVYSMNISNPSSFVTLQQFIERLAGSNNKMLVGLHQWKFKMVYFEKNI